MFVGDSANKPNGVIYRYYKCASAKRHECDRKTIFVYDDYIKLILTFYDKPINIPTSDEIENMANSSDIQSNVSPKESRLQMRSAFLFAECLNKNTAHSLKRADCRALPLRAWVCLAPRREYIQRHRRRKALAVSFISVVNAKSDFNFNFPKYLQRA